MGMSINKIFITGRVYGMGLSPMKNNGLYVAEGKLCVNNAVNAKGEILRDDFSIRCYGKQAEFFGKLEESWINANENGAYRGKTKDGTTFKWDAPSLPAWALPKGYDVKSESHYEQTQTKKNVIHFTDEQKAEMKRWNDGTFSKEELDKFKKQTTAPGADINGLVQWYADEYANRHATKVTDEEANGAEFAF